MLCAQVVVQPAAATAQQFVSADVTLCTIQPIAPAKRVQWSCLAQSFRFRPTCARNSGANLAGSSSGYIAQAGTMLRNSAGRGRVIPAQRSSRVGMAMVRGVPRLCRSATEAGSCSSSLGVTGHPGMRPTTTAFSSTRTPVIVARGTLRGLDFQRLRHMSTAVYESGRCTNQVADHRRGDLERVQRWALASRC